MTTRKLAAPIPFDAQRHIGLTRVSSVAVANDGRWLAVAAQRLDRKGAKYVSDLWRVDLGDGARPPFKLTSGESNDVAPAFRHDGALCFLSNRTSSDRDNDDEADKRMQVWALPAGGGEPLPLTDEPLGVQAFKPASAAAVTLILASVLPGVETERQREVASDRSRNGPSARRYSTQPVRYWDHWLADSIDGARTHLVALHHDGDAIARRVDLTPDVESQLAVEPGIDIDASGRVAVASWSLPGPDRIRDNALLVADTHAGTTRLLGVEPRHEHEQPALSPDGRQVAVIHTERVDGRAPTLRVATIDLASGERRFVAADWDAWPHLYGYSADGGSLLAGADRRGCTAVYRLDLATGRVDTLCDDATYSGIVPFESDGATRIAGIVADLSCPPTPFVASIGKVGKSGKHDKAVKVSLERLGPVGTPVALPEITVESFETRSTDGTPVHSLLIKPAKATTGPLPLVMFIHGGPIGCFGNAWHWRWNPLLMIERGYAVVLPNARGSTGYGQAFIDGIWNNQWGAQCYEDLMAVMDACCARDDIDETRTAAMGGSFGGYMTNWIGTQTDRFKCLVSHASVYWMSGFSGVTDLPAFWYLQMGSTPFKDPVAFDRYSPSAFVSQWKSPVLIIHGERDYRCPISESLMLYEALQHHGVDSELLVFPDENHWILKPRNVVAWYEAVLTHLDAHLQDA